MYIIYPLRLKGHALFSKATCCLTLGHSSSTVHMSLNSACNFL